MVEGPLIEKYLKALEENPRSRVFAPLAESYRRLGMVDRAIEILKDGMRYHPNYAVGYLGLAACYSDLGQYQLCYTTLKPFVPNSRDNLRLQRLFADACERIGHDYEALETYKFLLFLNPKDAGSAQKVAELEAKSDPLEDLSDSSKGELFPVDSLSSSEDLEEVSWVEVNFHKSEEAQKSVVQEQDSWEMISGSPSEIVESRQAPQRREEPTQLEQLTEHDQDSDREYVVEVSESGSESVESAGAAKNIEAATTSVKKDLASESVPLITHTLVDLYCNQGHFERAEEILLKMLALNPSDAPTLEKLQTVRLLLREAGLGDALVENEDTTEDEESSELETLEATSELESDDSMVAQEQDGRERLMEVFDSRVAKLNDSEGKTRGLNNFLAKIKARAKQRQDSTTRS